MSDNDSQSGTRQRKIYLKSLKKWLVVTDEEYFNFYREIWAVQARARTNGECRCTLKNMWLCDADCLSCEFHTTKKLSLDALIGDNTSFLDMRESPNSNTEEIACGQILLQQLMARASELDPDIAKIVMMLANEENVTDIAKILGRSRTTVNDLIKRIRRELREFCGDA